MIRKNQFIGNLKKDDIVNDIFVVKFKKPVEQYKNGYKFELRLGDSTKEIMYKYWGEDNYATVQQKYDNIRKDGVVRITGRVNEWNEKLEISANYNDRIEQIEEYDIRDFIRITDKDIGEMWDEFSGFMARIQDEEIRRVVDYFLSDEKFVGKFVKSPAAMYIHHGWIGGLLEHTLSVTKIAIRFCELYPELNRDLVLAGCFFHDIGKLREFKTTTNIQMTSEGMLIGHVTLGIEMLREACKETRISEEKEMKLVHMLLTHMGEYGSSKTPAIPEAMAVYAADRSDCDLTHMISAIKDANTEDEYIFDKQMGNIYLR